MVNKKIKRIIYIFFLSLILAFNIFFIGILYSILTIVSDFILNNVNIYNLNDFQVFIFGLLYVSGILFLYKINPNLLNLI